MTGSGTRFLPRDIARLCFEAGWIDADKLVIAIAVCLAESNGYEGARHVNADGSIDRGLWQINDRAHPGIPDSSAYDAVKATRIARGIYIGRGSTFNAWAAYTNGAYTGPRALGYAFAGVQNFLRLRHGYPVP